MASLRAQADRVERLMERVRHAPSYEREESLQRKAAEIVRALDNRRMLTNTPAAHREWERAYNALDNA